MAEEDLAVKIEATFAEGKIHKVATKLAVILTSKLPEHPDPAVLKALPGAIERSFHKRTATRESGSIAIVPGETPEKMYVCNLSWKKQKNYLFTITFKALGGSGAKPDDIRPKLVYARNLVHEYFRSAGIKSKDVPTA